jgi:2-succinyl-5-enolpyruvyl-6-hydroxy-3-cyclohexene-1-carboxylate synthase
VNPSTAFGAVLADELARCGLREVVVAPGSRSAPLAMAFDELDRAGRVRLHVRIDERAAAFTALGLAKASGRPVAVVCTSGSAAANFHPAVIEADESAIPLLLLTADRPPELRGTGASQTIDQVKLYGSAVRWYAESGVPERLPGMAGYWRSLACRAWAHAAGDLGTRPGPVHLNIPLRDPLVPDAQPATPLPVPSPPLPAPSSVPHASPGTAPGSDRSRWAAADWPDSLGGRPDGAPWTRVGGAAGVAVPLELPWAERGVVVCGDGDYDVAPLVELAEQAGWPVLAEPSSGARRGPNALVSYQYLLASPDFMAAHRPTVIVSAGRPGLSRPQSALLRLARDVASAHPGWAGTGWAGTGSRDTESEDARSVDAETGAAPPVRHLVIGQGPGLWADPQRAATDVALAVRLTGAPDRAPAEGTASSRWLDAWRTADAAATRAATAALEAWRGGELSEPEVARELVAALPGGALLWCGNSLSVRDIDLALSSATEARVMASRGASGIDGTFSTAAGAALAHAADHPGAVAFALIGDLSLLHDGAGLSIGPGEPRPDLCVVVVNNDGGGIFEGLEPARFGGGVSGRPQASQQSSPPPAAQSGGPAEAPVRPGEPPSLTVFERTFGTPHGASIEHLAAAFGIPYTLAERPGEIAKAVAATVPGSGPRIVEARTSRAPNADLRAHLRASAIRALAPSVG